MMALKHILLGGMVSALTAVGAQASPVNNIWANSAGGGAPILQEYDLSGNLLDTVTNTHGINGRGIVQVGNVVYYTTASTNAVYGYNFVTNTDLGTIFTVAGASGLATMAYDGTNFYLGDYSGTNNVYKYTPTGTLLATIPLSKCKGFCDGLEYAHGDLISNEFDGGFGGANTYDVYSTTGTLLQPGFIVGHNPSGNTGIAYDGTDYYVSNIFAGTISVFDPAGTWLRDITLQSPTNLVEDLSVNYSQVIPTPEPASMVLLASSLIGLASLRRRFNRR